MKACSVETVRRVTAASHQGRSRQALLLLLLLLPELWTPELWTPKFVAILYIIFRILTDAMMFAAKSKWVQNDRVLLLLLE